MFLQYLVKWFEAGTHQKLGIFRDNYQFLGFIINAEDDRSSFSTTTEWAVRDATTTQLKPLLLLPFHSVFAFPLLTLKSWPKSWKRWCSKLASRRRRCFCDRPRRQYTYSRTTTLLFTVQQIRIRWGCCCWVLAGGSRATVSPLTRFSSVCGLAASGETRLRRCYNIA